MKKTTSKVAHNQPQIFFQYCQPAQNQPKSQLQFHKNCSPHDLCIITLPVAAFMTIYPQAIGKDTKMYSATKIENTIGSGWLSTHCSIECM